MQVIFAAEFEIAAQVQTPHLFVAGQFLGAAGAVVLNVKTGEVVAMGGARQAHVLVSLRLASWLLRQLDGSPCRAYMSDMKLLIEAADGTAGSVRPLGGWNHLGIAVTSRDEVDRRIADADRAGFATMAASDSGPPVGYFGVIVDPDGHNLELAFGQEVAFTVAHSPEPT